MANHSPTDIDLLLIGKTGNGKSATGNTILRNTAFISKPSANSVTKNVQYEVSEFNGRVIKVVDGPGVGDTGLNNKKSVNIIMEAMEYAIACNPRGYHAFLLVVRFGGRFTEEDQETIAFLKRIFGENFVRDFCILVLTCGDNFEQESEETGVTFSEWCKEQEGVFQELLRECNHRVVLFDNKTKDDNKRNEQLLTLLQVVDNLRSHGHRYSDANFEKAKEARERIMVEAKKPMIKEETMVETSLIIQKLQEVQRTHGPEDQIQPLEILLKRIGKLSQSISLQDEGTGALHDLAEIVKSKQEIVERELNFCFEIVEEKERVRKLEKENTRWLQEEIRKQKEELARLMKQGELQEKERRRIERKQEEERREAEERRRKEQEEMEERLQAKLMEQQRQYQQELAELEIKYEEAKAENDKGFFDRIVDVITYPFRTIGKWFTG